MDAWVLWLIAAVVLGVGEVATLGFLLAPFAAGALGAALASAVGAGAIISWATFLVLSIVLLAALRPLARAHLRTPPRLRTGTDALVGQTGTVTQRIANGEGSGSVKLAGETWTARTYLDDEVIEAGRQVQVLEIRGATALVTE